ncbi:MAG: methionyl-tRNA formyltransferase [Desulfobacteraceae bacterium]|nr:methionyl-tRNA formyltransferase [Desulfobacteraceae bacterium]
MGTPDFAVPCLVALHNSRHQVLKVITQPDRPKGRGRKLTPPPIKETAMEFGYPVLQPISLQTPELMTELKSDAPDLFVVVAMGHILKPELLQIPSHGAVNIHASLLPKYRGAAPIHWAIVNGENTSGVSSMLMADGVDTGDILLSESAPIYADDTAGSLHDRLARVGASILIQTLDGLADERIAPRPQDHTQATYAPMLKKQDGHINWQLPARKLDAFIRGMTPWPGAFTFCGDKRLKIFKAHVHEADTNQQPGTILQSFPDELRVATGEGMIVITELQEASGKRMCTPDYLCGCEMLPGTVFE